MSLHLRVEDAGRGLDDARGSAVGLDLEDLAGTGVGDDGDQLNDDILGHHVENELEGELVLGAGRDGDVVPDGRQVAEDRGGLGRVGGQRLCSPERTANKGDVDWRLLVVSDLNQRLGDPAVDDLDAEDVGIGESRLDVGLEVGLLDRHRGLGRSVDLHGVCVSGCDVACCRGAKGELVKLKSERVAITGTTYIVLREDGCNAQGEQGERRPLEVDHCARFRRRGRAVDEGRRKERGGKVGSMERGPDPNWQLGRIDVVNSCVQCGQLALISVQLLAWCVLQGELLPTPNMHVSAYRGLKWTVRGQGLHA